MRKNWTDERLDDLNQRVAEGFARVDADLRAMRLEMKTEFVALRGEMNAMRGELNAVQRLILQVGGGIVATFAVGFLGVIVTLL